MFYDYIYRIACQRSKGKKKKKCLFVQVYTYMHICTKGIPLVVQLQNDGINGANGSAADRRSGSAIIHK